MMTGVLKMTDAELRRIDLEELMRGCKKVILQHGRRPYCLAITRRGNLILTSADDGANSEDKPDRMPEQTTNQPL